MCKYSVLAKSGKGFVRYCHDCQTYCLNFGNIVMNFDQVGYDQFKKNVEMCYEEHAECLNHRDLRKIFFDTKVEGLQLVFSTEEVGALLSLMQLASLEAMGIIESEEKGI